MHGLGNDFVIIDGISQPIDIQSLTIPNLADRHLGIGFNQLLFIYPTKKADVACQIFNADGSEAEQCGNGMRCVARFLHEEKITDKKSLRIETKAGIMQVLITNYDDIQVNMGNPCFEPDAIPCKANQIKKRYELPLDENQTHLTMAVLSMGNPHAILQVNSVLDFPVEKIAPQIARHAFFPHGTNVGFMEIVDPKHIRLRTYERGVGETVACGSNACAAVVSGIQNHSLDHKVKVELRYGTLWIEWDGAKGPVLMSGPAARVFSGSASY